MTFAEYYLPWFAMIAGAYIAAKTYTALVAVLGLALFTISLGMLMQRAGLI